MADYLMGSLLVFVLGLAVATMVLREVRSRIQARKAVEASDTARRQRTELRDTDELLRKINQATSQDDLDALDSEREKD